MFNLDFMMLIGLLGQGLFSMRFIIQWIASERAGKSVVPFSFWLFSLGGSIFLLIMYMVLSTLTAISPVDGRYRNKAENLAAYFSEYALIKYRVRVEIEYFITLSEFLPQLSELNAAEVKKGLRKIYQELYGRETLTMEGDPSLPVIVDTWMKGLRFSFDMESRCRGLSSLTVSTERGENCHARLLFPSL